jgi:hypothetical protein
MTLLHSFKSSIAYYCLHKFHMLPSQFVELEENEKAFVIASIQIKIDAEKRKQKEMENKVKNK